MKNILKINLGKVPLYIILPIAAVVFFAAKHNDLSNDMIGGLAAMMVAGFMLRAIGEQVPILNRIGGAPIMCIFVPSFLVAHRHLWKHPTLSNIQS